MKLNPPAPRRHLPTLLHRALCVFLLWALLLPFPLWANPTGESVESGIAEFYRSERNGIADGLLEIGYVHDGTIITWGDSEGGGFDIGPGERTVFLFNHEDSRVLNRDMSGNLSEIMGLLHGRLQFESGELDPAAGQIFLVNPNGIVIDGMIDAGAFFGVAGDLSDAALLGDPNSWLLDATLTGDVIVNAGGVINANTMGAHEHYEGGEGGGPMHETLQGSVVLLGQHVQNLGTIFAPGTVALVAGDEATLALLDSSITVQALSGGDPTPGAIGVDQQGDITGNAGIQLAASDMYALGVNTTGVLDTFGDVNISATAFSGGEPVAGSNSGIELSTPSDEPIEGDNVVFEGDVTLVGDTNVTSYESTRFAGTVDGGHALEVTQYDGPIDVEGDIGSATPLESVLLSVTGYGYGDDSSSISTQDITTSTGDIHLSALGYASEDSAFDITTGDLTAGEGSIVVEADDNIHVGAPFNPDGIPGTEPSGGSIDTTTGDVSLTAGGDLTVGGSITSSEGGDIDLFASDDVHVGDAVETTTGNVDLVANEDVTVGGGITTTTGNVTVTADDDGLDAEGEGAGYAVVGGLIDTAGDDSGEGPIGYVTVTGESVTVADVNTVDDDTGTSSPLTLSAPIDVTTGVLTTAGSDIDIDADNDATVGGTSMTTGNLDVDAGNDATVTGLISTDGDIHVQAGNDAAVDGVTTTVGNVEVIAGNDAGVTGPITTTTGNVTVTANEDGVGGGDAEVTGNINTDGNGPGIGAVTVTGESVTVADVNTVNEATDTSSPLTLSGFDVETGVLTTTDEDIDVDADNIALVGGASTTTGNVTIEAGADLHVGDPFNPDGTGLEEPTEPNGGSIDTTTGNVALTAGDDLTVGGSIISTDGGEIDLIASDDVHVGGSVETTTADVNLVAGDDVTVGGAETTTGNVTIEAGDDLHVGDAFNPDGTEPGDATEPNGGSIDTTTGNVALTAGDDLTVGGSITSTDGGEIDLTASEDIHVGGSVSTTTGNVDLVSDEDVTVDGGIETTTGNVTVIADVDIHVGDPFNPDGIDPAVPTEPNGGSIDTTTGNVDLTAGGDLTVGGSITSTDGGEIDLFASDDIHVGDSISNTTGDVVLEANEDITVGGGITTTTGNVTVAANGDGEDGDAFVGGTINTAGNGPDIGSVTVTGENVTVADVDTVDEATGTSSDLTLNAPINVTTGVLTTAGGDIDVDAGNDATVGGTSMTTGNLDVDAGNDAIVTGPIATDGNVHVQGGNDAAVDGVTTTVGNVEVIAGNDARVTGPIETTTGQVLVQANHDATVDGSVTTTTGNVTVAADADQNLDGDALVVGAIDTEGNGPTVGSVNVTGVNVTVGDVDTAGDGTGSDLTLSGVDVVTGVLSTGSGDIEIDATQDATVGGTAGMTGNVVVDAGNDAAVGGTIETEGDVHVQAGNDVSVEGISTTTGEVEVIAGQNAAVSGGIETTSGDVLVDAGNDASVSGSITTGSGSVQVLADNDASVSGVIETSGGNVTVTADRDGTNGGDAAVDGRIASGGGNVAVTGQHLDIASIQTSGGNLELEATAPDGRIELDGDLDAGNSGDILLQAGDSIVLQGNTSVSGGAVDIASEVEGQGGASFTVEGNRITLRDDVTTGGSQTYEGSEIRVGADSGDYTSRNGSVTFDGDTVLEGDTNVSSSDSSSFNGTIDGRFDLEVDAGRNVNIGGDIGGGNRVGNLVLDGRDGVNISGDIDAGGNIELLSQRGDIVFDADGRNADTTVVAGGSIVAGSDLGSVPNRASIYAAPGADSLTFDAGDDFTMGENQKMSANELAIFAGDTARVGDLSAIESIIVGANTVTFNTRQPGEVLTSDGGVIQETGSNLPDVVANEVTIEGNVTNPDQVTFSTATGTVQGGTDFPAVFLLGRGLQSRDLLSGGTVLDLAAIGDVGVERVDPTLQDQAPTLEFISLVPLAAVSVADVGRLRAAEVLAFLRCGLLEGGEDEDLPEYCLLPHVGEGPPGEESEQVAIPEELVGSEPALVAASIYRRLTDPGSGAGKAREALLPAFTGFESQSGSPIDGREFSRFVGTDTEYSAAAGYLDEAGFLFEQLEKIGMDEVEYQELRMMLLDEVSSMVGLASLSPEVLGASIEARR